MMNIIIATHGKLGKELLSTAAMMTGPLAGVTAVGLEPECSLEEFSAQLNSILKQSDNSQGSLILADLLGGTPANVAAGFSKHYKLQVVTGINLPMLLEVYLSRNGTDLQVLADLAVQAGTGAVRCLA